MKHSFTVLFLCVLALGTNAQSVTDEGTFASMLGQPAEECAQKIASGEISLAIKPETTPVTILQVFSEKLLQRGIHVSTGPSTAPITMNIDVREMNSSTVLRDNSSYLRHASIRMGVLVRNTQTGAVLWSKEYSLSQSDTLQGIPSYRETNHLVPETESWWETYATPVLASVAALVIVVLLFTVRGS
jgi:hypothetical protein